MIMIHAHELKSSLTSPPSAHPAVVLSRLAEARRPRPYYAVRLVADRVAHVDKMKLVRLPFVQRRRPLGDELLGGDDCLCHEPHPFAEVRNGSII